MYQRGRRGLAPIRHTFAFAGTEVEAARPESQPL